MKNQSFSAVWMKLVATKEGKKFLHQSIKAFFTHWAKNSFLKRIIAKIILICINPFIKENADDTTLQQILNDESWWQKVSDSILHSIAANDMAVLKSYADSISNYAPGVVAKVADDIWMYPAKVLTLFACIPSVANCMIRCVNVTLKPLNNQAPDLLADVVNSLIKEIDSETVGCTVNQLCELIRKFDTGDELIKEAAITPFEHSVRDIVSKVLLSLDDKTKQQVFVSLLSLKNKIAGGVFESLSKHPDTLSMLINFVILNKLQNIATTRKLLNSYSTQESPQDFPVEEAAHFLNDLLRFIVVVHSTNKPLFDSILNRFTHALDRNAFQDFITQAGNECFTALQPVLVHIFPFVLTCWTRLLQEEDDAMQQARKAFARALLKDVEESNV